MSDDLIPSQSCKTCGEAKPLHDFHWREDRKKHRTECRNCWNARYGQRHGTEEYKVRKRELEGLRRGTPINNARESRHSKKYREKYPEKALAKRLVRAAIVRGDLQRPETCEACHEAKPTIGGRARIHAHHKDYSKPLDVVWLCPVCHAKEHSNAA